MSDKKPSLNRELIKESSIIARDALLEIVRSGSPPTPNYFDSAFRSVCKRKKSIKVIKYLIDYDKTNKNDQVDKISEEHMKRVLTNMTLMAIQTASDLLSDHYDIVDILEECSEDINLGLKTGDFLEVIKKLKRVNELAAEKSMKSSALVPQSDEVKRFRDEILLLENDCNELKEIMNILLQGGEFDSFREQILMSSGEQLSLLKKNLKNQIFKGGIGRTTRLTYNDLKDLAELTLSFLLAAVEANVTMSDTVKKTMSTLNGEGEDLASNVIEDLREVFDGFDSYLAKLEQQKRELKEIINTLLEGICALADSNNSFVNKLDNYKSGIENADKIDDIVSIKKKLIYETSHFQVSAKKSQEQFEQVKQNMTNVQDQIEKYQKELTESRKLTFLDTITGLPNRRAFAMQLSDLVSKWINSESIGCIIFIGINNFEKIKTEYNAAILNEIFVEITNRAKTTISSDDYLVKYSTSVFGLICSNSDSIAANNIAENIRMDIADSLIKTQKGDLNITVSLAITALKNNDDARTLLNRAKSTLEYVLTQESNITLTDEEVEDN